MAHGNGSGNPGAGGNSNSLSMMNRGVIGDGRNRRRGSVDVNNGDSADDTMLLSNNNNNPNNNNSNLPLPHPSSEGPLSLPPGLGGLNLSGNLGLLTGLNHNSHMHHVNPLSLSMGAEDDMGISRFMVERLQGEVTKLQSDNLKLRRKLKDSGVDISEGGQQKGNVGFAFVKTREFTPAQGLGVPSTGAAPLGLGFSPLNEDTEELLDGYERRREAERKGVLRIPEDQRKAILIDHGATEESLEEEARNLNKINWGRLESMASPTENPLPEQQRQVFRKFLYQP